jgi:hypothetical protein
MKKKKLETKVEGKAIKTKEEEEDGPVRVPW